MRVNPDGKVLSTNSLAPITVGRKALPAICLTNDMAMVTAVSNDVGFADVFSRQITARATLAIAAARERHRGSSLRRSLRGERHSLSRHAERLRANAHSQRRSKAAQIRVPTYRCEAAKSVSGARRDRPSASIHRVAHA